MEYVSQLVASNLLYICWYPTPCENSRPESAFIGELAAYLRDSSGPFYFLSNLRQGRITDRRTLQALGLLTKHENWGGSAAFSDELVSGAYVNVFTAYASKKEREIWDTPEDAIAALEVLKPGLTSGIDWKAVIK